jgi:hypothetical protein
MRGGGDGGLNKGDEGDGDDSDKDWVEIEATEVRHVGNGGGVNFGGDGTDDGDAIRVETRQPRGEGCDDDEEEGGGDFAKALDLFKRDEAWGLEL